MDYVYARLNNNLIQINRIKDIFLKKALIDGEPLPSLKAGDFYLEITVIDSDRPVYGDLSAINAEQEDILDKLIAEQNRAIAREDEIEANAAASYANQLEISQEIYAGTANIALLNSAGQVLDSAELQLATGKALESITLDYPNKRLVFTLVDGTILYCDITDLIDDLAQKIDQERERALNAEETLNTAIVAETQLRISADQSLGGQIAAEHDRATAEEDALATAINTEQSAREAADQTLDNKITAEQERAIGQEGILSHNIVLEIQDRINADIELGGKIAEEKSRAENAEATLNTKLNTEIAARQAADQAINEDLATETLNRQTADSALSGRITTLETLVTPDSGYETLAGLMYIELE